MGEIRVEIKWDSPKDKRWLNKDNIAIALSTYCKNTKFEVREIKDEPKEDPRD